MSSFFWIFIDFACAFLQNLKTNRKTTKLTMVRQLAARKLVSKDKGLVRAGGKGAFKGFESCLGILVCDGTSNAQHFWEAAFLITSKKNESF